MHTSRGLLEGTRSIKDTIAEVNRIISLCNEFVYCIFFVFLFMVFAYENACSQSPIAFKLQIQQSIFP